eukprot:2361390-Amphidinium_carterae.1
MVKLSLSPPPTPLSNTLLKPATTSSFSNHVSVTLRKKAKLSISICKWIVTSLELNLYLHNVLSNIARTPEPAKTIDYPQNR